MSEALPRLELRFNRRIFGILLALCLLLLVLFRVPWVPFWEAPFIYFLCAVLIPFSLWGLFDRRPQLRIDEMGIQYARWGRILVQWAEISHFELRHFRGTPHITAVPRNLSLLRTRVPMAWRLNGYFSRMLGLGEFAIQAGGLDGGIDEIKAILEHYHAVRTASES